jgi:predicted acyl esterase
MKSTLTSFAFLLLASSPAFGQLVLNGQLDDIQELSTPYTEDFVMPDGTILKTDIYLPISRDSLVVPVDIDIPGFLQGVFGQSLNYELELIPRNLQYLLYDSVYDCSAQQLIRNPNPYKLPLVFSRTPYRKGNGDAVEGTVIALLGYAFANQDMRGRYTSEGVYLPLITDSWNKNAYHPNYTHALDKLPMEDPRASNRNEDGHNSIEYIRNDLKRMVDLDGDGIAETEDLLYNGRIAMFGASALGYNQYQAAAAHRINTDEPGLKALFPIVAPAEFYKSTGFQNGVLREQLVTGWLRGQIFSGTDDDLNDIDDDPHNTLHSSSDYDLPKNLILNGVPLVYERNMYDAANLAIDHFVAMRYTDPVTGDLLPSGQYPLSPGRLEMDVSRAMVDENGESVTKGKIVNGVVVDATDDDPEGILGMGSTPRPNLVHSRYTNMEVPTYHLSGWYDIFVDGQTETTNYLRKYLRSDLPNGRLQKLVIGPWAHQTIGQVTTGDRTYPDNVTDVVGINFSDFSGTNLPIDRAINSEILSWFRYNLNYRCDGNGYEYREPVFILPPSNNPVILSEVEIPFAGTAYLRLRVPADTLRLQFDELLRVLAGTDPVSGLTAELIWEVPLLGNGSTPIDLPSIELGPVIPGISGEEINGIPFRDFLDENDVPNVRLYVIGPNDDPEYGNSTLGSYWLSADTFPLAEGTIGDPIQRRTLYLHNDGSANYFPPTTDEGSRLYVHDPNDPIRTIGGGNMIVKTPDGLRDSQGQFNLADSLYIETTMEREGVIQFSTEPITEDSLSIIGFPTAQLWATSNIDGLTGGPTDTDFFVRVVDVYPDGREYFVVEGAVNARAKDYAKALVNDPASDLNFPHPIDQIPFSNIEIGQLYEYEFSLLPIAYTFGVGHRIKVLISSSNWTRYQVNPNLPIMPGEFFRRQPNDGLTYIYEGQEMEPRVAVNSIHFAPQHPSNITLPVYGPALTVAADDLEPASPVRPDVLLHPNPATNEVSIYVNDNGQYLVSLMDVSGATVAGGELFRERTTIDVSKLAPGVYFVELRGERNGERIVKRLVRN